MVRVLYLQLVVICLLLCSCRSKSVVSQTENYERITSEITSESTSVVQDTTKTEKVEQAEEYTRIYESETIIEYDTEKGVPSKVTTKEKITESGNKTQRNETENRGLNESESKKTDADIDSELEENTETETEESLVSDSFFGSFGKWLGIGILLIILAYIIWRKLKNNLSLWKS